MTVAELLKPELLAYAAGGFMANVAGLFVTPAKLKRIAAAAATEAATAAVKLHADSCPGRTLLQPLASDPHQSFGK